MGRFELVARRDVSRNALHADRAVVSGERVQEINVNLWWGLVLLAVGLVMLGFALRARGARGP